MIDDTSFERLAFILMLKKLNANREKKMSQMMPDGPCTYILVEARLTKMFFSCTLKSTQIIWTMLLPRGEGIYLLLSSLELIIRH